MSLFLTWQLEIYQTQRALVFLMHNFALATVGLNLQLQNMAKKNFYQFQPAILIIILPIVNDSYDFGIQNEVLLPICTGLSLIFFYLQIVILSK
jgi:hypothetical protein